jgi:hypothetical protein
VPEERASSEPEPVTTARDERRERCARRPSQALTDRGVAALRARVADFAEGTLTDDLGLPDARIT